MTVHHCRKRGSRSTCRQLGRARDTVSHLSGQRETDNTGFFVEYLFQPGLYTVAVEYQGLSATKELTLKVGEQRDDLVFTLDGAPVFFLI